jgi:hypothetical protein
MDFGYVGYPVLGMVVIVCEAYDLKVELGILCTSRRDLNWNEHKLARQRFCRRQWA